MRKAVVTWRLSFSSAPESGRLAEVCGLLGPVARSGQAEDHGAVLREYGLWDYVAVEEEMEVTAGELALNCLMKAHRLGLPWSVMWPGFTAAPGGGWPATEWARAARPECLDGLSGGFEASGPRGKALVPGLAAASFRVEVREKMVVKPAPPAKPAVPARKPSVESVEFNVYIRPNLDKLLTRHRLYPWTWKLPETRLQVERFGFSLAEERDDELVFTGSEVREARVRFEGGSARWIEFVLASLPDPHLLDELEFDRRQSEYESLFHNAVNHIEKFFGPPLFAGASGDAGFPADQWADWAAVWAPGGYRFIVEQKHNDKELPLELCLVVGPD